MTNLLLNPCGQIKRIQSEFLSLASGDMTLARWRVLMDAAGRVKVRQLASPSRIEMEWASSGLGAFFQPIESLQFQPLIGEIGYVSAKFGGTSVSSVKALVVKWTGTADKCSINPVSGWSLTPNFASNWSLVHAETLAVTGGRVISSGFTIPDASNLAIIFLADGAAGNKLHLSIAQISPASDFMMRDYGAEVAANGRFFNIWTHAILKNTEFCWGITKAIPNPPNAPNPRGLNIHLRLPYEMRGRHGGAGTQDITVDWQFPTPGYAAESIWFAYAGGFDAAIAPTPTLSCHHRDFLFFNGLTAASQPALPQGHVFTIRDWYGSGIAQAEAIITACAELRP